MVNWNEAPGGAVDVRLNGQGVNRFTNGVDKFYDPSVEVWMNMSFAKHDWPVVETRPLPTVAVPLKTVTSSSLQMYEDSQPRNKYDREIIGKYGTGKCTVDVYRVLYAFETQSPDVDHAVKKLLAPGSRGHKDERQDLLEAIQSIEARLQYLESCDG